MLQSINQSNKFPCKPKTGKLKVHNKNFQDRKTYIYTLVKDCIIIIIITTTTTKIVQ